MSTFNLSRKVENFVSRFQLNELNLTNMYKNNRRQETEDRRKTEGNLTNANYKKSSALTTIERAELYQRKGVASTSHYRHSQMTQMT